LYNVNFSMLMILGDRNAKLVFIGLIRYI